MSNRGVTRPMALEHPSHEPQKHSPQQPTEEKDAKRDSRDHPGSESHSDERPSGDRESGETEKHTRREANDTAVHDPTSEQRHAMLRMHHQNTLWIYWTLVLLGSWLLLAPFSFGHLNEQLWVEPSGGRGPWFAETPSFELTQWRAWLTTGSDLVSGALLMFFGFRSLEPNRPLSRWACCLIGMWLTFAPILFWAPTAASYVNDSLVGMLVIALSILIPGMPNMPLFMQHGPATPPGWSFNPSSWPQRWSMIVLGFLGFVVSRYLAMYQLGYIDRVWDPFFGWASGTKQVLDSKMSHALPISDAGLGTVSYTFEFLMGYMGSQSRWRTMPWMVAFFGVLVVPLGLTHIFLVSSQPVLVHAWCTFCLLAAAIMLPMIPLEIDEVVAMLQHLRQAKQRGDRHGSLWAVFWKGGSAEGCTDLDPAPPLSALPDRPGAVLLASIRGMSAPWTLVLSAALGVGLMLAPALFGVPIESHAADVAHLGGALTVTVSVVAMAEVVRTGRLLNVLLGAAVAIAVWLVGAPTHFAVASSVLGAAVTMAALPKGRIEQNYGEWNRCIR